MGMKGNKICHKNDINEGFFYLDIMLLCGNLLLKRCSAHCRLKEHPPLINVSLNLLCACVALPHSYITVIYGFVYS